jgi:hypothetical protein
MNAEVCASICISTIDCTSFNFDSQTLTCSFESPLRIGAQFQSTSNFTSFFALDGLRRIRNRPCYSHPHRYSLRLKWNDDFWQSSVCHNSSIQHSDHMSVDCFLPSRIYFFPNCFGPPWAMPTL